MGKKKKKVARLTEEEYKAYILRMKEESFANHHTGEQNFTPTQNEEQKKDN